MGKMAEFATRLLGSRDIFPKSLRHSFQCFVCYHDGFTLEDTVCYEQRHNQANTETAMGMAKFVEKLWHQKGLLLTRGSAGSVCNKTEYAGDPVVVARYPAFIGR